MIHILYDGWSLSYRPNSPEALHLMALLACGSPEVQASVGLPAPPPAWLPENVMPVVELAAATPRAHLAWEQRLLPRLAGRLGAEILHLVAPSPALLCRVATVVSPASALLGTRAEGAPGFFDRLRDSAASGGMARLSGLLWPEDLPKSFAGLLLAGQAGEVFSLPPVVYPAFLEEGTPDRAGLDLPPDYVLYHGPGGRADLRHVFEIWSWAAGSIGDYYPLILLGYDAIGRSEVERLGKTYGIEAVPVSLPGLSPAQIATVYRGCSALLHPGVVSPWGSPLRPALACRKPVVAAESALADSLVGPAAYLAPAGDARALGAALITVLVEEDLAAHLSQAARQRAAAWEMERFPERLLETYQRILS